MSTVMYLLERINFLQLKIWSNRIWLGICLILVGHCPSPTVILRPANTTKGESIHGES